MAKATTIFKRKITKASVKSGATGLLMVAPTIIGLIILNIYPLLKTIWMSFYKSGSFGKWKFVGSDNYTNMFTSSEFWKITMNTIIFVLLTVPVTIAFGLLIAVLLDQKIKGKTVFRAIYFLPMVVAPAAVAMVWKWMFNTEYGIINTILGFLNLPSNISWITDSRTVLISCAVVTIWSSVGYDAILLLSGIQSISRTYYDAAKIDGASTFVQFKKITVPLVSPTMFFVVIMRVMASLKAFDIVYMMVETTNPAIRSAETILYTFYKESFVSNNKGYGSAIVLWSVFIISIVTVTQFVGQKKWVTYDM